MLPSPGALRSYATTLDGAAGTVDEVRRLTRATASASGWSGPAQQSFSVVVLDLTARLGDAAENLRADAHAVRRAADVVEAELAALAKAAQAAAQAAQAAAKAAETATHAAGAAAHGVADGAGAVGRLAGRLVRGH